MKTSKFISILFALIITSITIYGFKANVKSGTNTITYNQCNGSGKCCICHGSGSTKCFMCFGTGKNTANIMANIAAKAFADANSTTYTPLDKTCGVCNGTGKVGCNNCNATGVCPKCNGTGEMQR